METGRDTDCRSRVLEDSLLGGRTRFPGDTVYVSVIVGIGTVTHCVMQEWSGVKCLWRSVAGEAAGGLSTDW